MSLRKGLRPRRETGLHIAQPVPTEAQLRRLAIRLTHHHGRHDRMIDDY